MRRSPRMLLTWAAALAVALTTARVVTGDLAALHRRAGSLGPRRAVVVAARDLPIGHTIGRGDLATAARYEHEVPREAVTDPGALVGRVVVVPVLHDDYVFSGHVAPVDRTGVDGLVPPGDRAVHVVPHDGFRPPVGSVVDVLAAYDPSVVTVAGATDAAVAVARGARVVAVDDASPGASGADGAGVTVVVTEGEARTIAFAASAGDLSLAVAPPEACCGPAVP